MGRFFAVFAYVNGFLISNIKNLRKNVRLPSGSQEGEKSRRANRHDKAALPTRRSAMIEATSIDAWQRVIACPKERIVNTMVNVEVGQVVCLLITVLEESA